MYLYDAFLDNKDIVIAEYEKVLAKMPHLPKPVSEVIKVLASGKDVTYVEFLTKIREYLE